MCDDCKPIGFNTLAELAAAIIEHERRKRRVVVSAASWPATSRAPVDDAPRAAGRGVTP
jgi:hypothetical protein